MDKILYLMVPFEAFSMSSAQSWIAFCSGCDGGTQCDSFSSNVLSSAEAAPAPSAKAIIAALQNTSGCIRRIMSSRLMD